MKLRLIIFIIASYVFGQPSFSQEKWMPEILSIDSIYLPDYSFAGYQWGEKEIPLVEGKIFNVTDFGATADDDSDDTESIIKTIDAASKETGNVVIQFPPGKFIIKQIIWIKRSNIVLSGSGSGENGTVLFMPEHMGNMKLPQSLSDYKKYLLDNDKRVSSGELFSIFSWTGGIIWTEAPVKEVKKLSLIGDGKRGGQTFSAEDISQLKIGQTVEIRWYNSEGKTSSLLNHILDNQKLECGERFYEDPSKAVVTQEVFITKIEENKIFIKEKLLLDVKDEWHCDVYETNFIENVGFENFKIEFPSIEYGGHHLEHGYNAFYLTGLMNSWVKDVVVKNSDSGILSDFCKNVTIQNFNVEGRLGHYTVHLGNCRYMLLKDFDFDAPSWHSPSFNTHSRLNVCTHGNVEHAILDQHSGMNQQNLYDDLKLKSDDISRLFEHGGAGYYKPAAGAFNTFWNIFVEFDEDKLTGLPDAPSARIVGLHGSKNISLQYGPNAYIEGLNKSNIAVPSLYEYQFNKRNEVKKDKLLFLDEEKMIEVRASLLRGETEYKTYLDKILKDAEDFLSLDILSVVDKEIIPPSGDKHDYISMGPYWWPDPDKPDGLPYIRKDGYINPEVEKYTDKTKLRQIILAAGTLSLAYYFTDDEKYAEQASKLLRGWFINPETKMNPNLNFAQSIPGKSKGRGIGIIDSRNFTEVTDAAVLLTKSKAWTNEDHRQLKNWFGEFLNWLIESKNGKEEAAASNNHGTWYDVQTSGIALFLGRDETARKIIEEAKEKRIGHSVVPDGTQPEELARTNSFNYSVFNLEAMIKLSLLAAHVDINLWDYTSAKGGSIKKALDYLVPFALGEKEWEHKQIKAIYSEGFCTLLKTVSKIYNIDEYAAASAKFSDIDLGSNMAMMISLRK